jgi:hypothetical protein
MSAIPFVTAAQGGFKPGEARLTIDGNPQIGSIPVLGFSFNTVALQDPRDAPGGSPTGRRRYAPVVITTDQGDNSTHLIRIMNSGTVLPRVHIESGSGHLISLLNAKIVAIHLASVGGSLQDQFTLIFGSYKIDYTNQKTTESEPGKPGVHQRTR